MTLECELASYDLIHHHYLEIGENVGNVFSDVKTLK